MKRTLTLIEVMVALFLLAVCSSVVGVRMYKAIQKKKFTSEIDRLYERFFTIHRLATASQSDWKGVLIKEEQGWVFQAVSSESTIKRIKPLRLSEQKIYLEGKEIKSLEIDFFSSGSVHPAGAIHFIQGKNSLERSSIVMEQKTSSEKS